MEERSCRVEDRLAQRCHPFSIFKLLPPHDQPFSCAESCSPVQHFCSFWSKPWKCLIFNPPGALFPTLPLSFSPVQSNTQDACVADVHMYGFVLLFFFFLEINFLFIAWGREKTLFGENKNCFQQFGWSKFVLKPRQNSRFCTHSIFTEQLLKMYLLTFKLLQVLQIRHLAKHIYRSNSVVTEMLPKVHHVGRLRTCPSSSTLREKVKEEINKWYPSSR